MLRRQYFLVSEERLLVQPLAWAHTGIADLDVAPHLEPGEADQIGGEVHDPDRLAHVEDEDLPAMSQGTGLKHELHGLGNGHEVAAHLGVRDRQRPTRIDLPQEDWDDAAATAQNVSE